MSVTWIPLDAAADVDAPLNTQVIDYVAGYFEMENFHKIFINQLPFVNYPTRGIYQNGIV